MNAGAHARARVSVQPMGDAALLLRWGRAGAAGAPAAVSAAYRSIRAARIAGVVDVVPAPASMLVRFDPDRVSASDLGGRLVPLATAPAVERRPRQHRLPVRYGGEAGPDLEEVAARLGLSPAQVVARHTSRTYTVLATGFAPGFVYLGPLPPSLRLARRQQPRVSVPAGSVAIGDAQTGVYGVRSGGGWWLIGRTEVPTFRPEKRPPTRFTIGDRVTFEARG
jgi:KipI family sensor histidine kinase inhibitor